MGEGTLQERLKACGADFNRDASFDGYKLLPSWLHSRKSV